MSRPPSERPLLIRPARADDREAVLAFSRQTWSWGDYLEHVWDEWLESSDGRLLVGEADGRPVGVGRARLVAPGQGWLEGLRVDPSVRRKGIGRKMTVATLGAARDLGATVVRFATRADADPVHRIAERLGLVKVASYYVLAAPALEDGGPTPRVLDAADEEAAWHLVSDLSLRLTWRMWHCVALDREELGRRLSAGEALGWSGEGADGKDPDAVAFAVPEAEDGELVVDLLAARETRGVGALSAGLRRAAAAQRLARVSARALEDPAQLAALAESGFPTPGEYDVPFWIFEWREAIDDRHQGECSRPSSRTSLPRGKSG